MCRKRGKGKTTPSASGAAARQCQIFRPSAAILMHVAWCVAWCKQCGQFCFCNVFCALVCFSPRVQCGQVLSPPSVKTWNYRQKFKTWITSFQQKNVLFCRSGLVTAIEIGETCAQFSIFGVDRDFAVASGFSQVKRYSQTCDI